MGFTRANVWLLLLGSACSISPEGVEPGSCSDRADNDGDYTFDCDDPDCARSPDCAEMDGTDADDSGDGSDGSSATCNNNDYRLTFEDGTTLTLNAWIWQEGWGGAHLVGLASPERDGCAVATELFTEFTGYDSWFLQIDVGAVPEEGSIVRIQESSDGPDDATARLENLTTGALETSRDGGRMNVRRVALGGVFEASDVYTRMSGGTSPQGDLVACWCEGTPIGPEPDN